MFAFESECSSSSSYTSCGYWSFFSQSQQRRSQSRANQCASMACGFMGECMTYRLVIFARRLPTSYQHLLTRGSPQPLKSSAVSRCALMRKHMIGVGLPFAVFHAVILTIAMNSHGSHGS